MLTRTLAQSLAIHGIRVNGIATGVIRTELNVPLLDPASVRHHEKKMLGLSGETRPFTRVVGHNPREFRFNVSRRPATTRARWKSKRLLRTVHLPVRYLTSCAFGGPRRDRLYITTATEKSAGENEPHAGAVFQGHPNTVGLELACFAGE